jgi:hypothetical protein
MEAQSCGTSCTPSWPALCVAVAARPWYRLLRPWCLPSFDFSGFSYCGGDKWSCVAQTCPLKGFYLCMTSPTRPTADENKLACLDVAASNRLSTYSSLVVFLALSGLLSILGFSAANAHLLHDHFVQFTYSVGGLRARRSFLQIIWLACV